MNLKQKKIIEGSFAKDHLSENVLIDNYCTTITLPQPAYFTSTGSPKEETR